MWIDIFELTNGDIESVELYWDKKICYEATFADEEGIDEKGYVGNDNMGLGRHRIIEIKDKAINKMLMFILSQCIFDCDKKYKKVKICTKNLKQWLGDKMSEREDKMKEIEEVRKIIKDFADHDLYSANCEEVKYLYKRLRRLEGRVEEIDYEENYEPQFIGGSDVPINGYYE